MRGPAAAWSLGFRVHDPPGTSYKGIYFRVVRGPTAAWSRGFSLGCTAQCKAGKAPGTSYTCASFRVVQLCTAPQLRGPAGFGLGCTVHGPRDLV